MRRFTALTLVLALVLAAFALAGCGAIAQKATEAAVEKTTGVKVDTDNQTITTTDKDGNQSTLSAAEGAYPDGFPSDFPQYPNGTVDSGLKSTTDGQDAFTVIVNTPDAAKDVYDWYTAELEKRRLEDRAVDGRHELRSRLREHQLHQGRPEGRRHDQPRHRQERDQHHGRPGARQAVGAPSVTCREAASSDGRGFSSIWHASADSPA